MSVTALVSHMLMSPYMSAAAAGSSHQAATATRSVRVVNVKTVGATVGTGVTVGPGLMVGSELGGAVTMKESEGEHGAPEPLAATVVEPAKVISQLISLGNNPPHVYGSNVFPT